MAYSDGLNVCTQWISMIKVYLIRITGSQEIAWIGLKPEAAAARIL